MSINIFEELKAFNDIQEWAFQNLFSANHRGAMIRNHGGTQAQIMQVQFNKQTRQAEIVN